MTLFHFVENQLDSDGFAIIVDLGLGHFDGVVFLVVGERNGFGLASFFIYAGESSFFAIKGVGCVRCNGAIHVRNRYGLAAHGGGGTGGHSHGSFGGIDEFECEVKGGGEGGFHLVLSHVFSANDLGLPGGAVQGFFFFA